MSGVAKKQLGPKVKGGWTREEDALLVQLVNDLSEGQWSKIARALNSSTGKDDSYGRIGKQCRERWNHHLKPGINKEAWTLEEEGLLVQAHMELGNRWSEIAKSIPGRSENAVKNHWNATKRRRDVPDPEPGPLKTYLQLLSPKGSEGGIYGGNMPCGKSSFSRDGGNRPGKRGGGAGTARKRAALRRAEEDFSDEGSTTQEEDEAEEAGGRNEEEWGLQACLRQAQLGIKINKGLEVSTQFEPAAAAAFQQLHGTRSPGQGVFFAGLGFGARGATPPFHLGVPNYLHHQQPFHHRLVPFTTATTQAASNFAKDIPLNSNTMQQYQTSSSVLSAQPYATASAARASSLPECFAPWRTGGADPVLAGWGGHSDMLPSAPQSVVVAGAAGAAALMQSSLEDRSTSPGAPNIPYMQWQPARLTRSRSCSQAQLQHMKQQQQHHQQRHHQQQQEQAVASGLPPSWLFDLSSFVQLQHTPQAIAPRKLEGSVTVPFPAGISNHVCALPGQGNVRKQPFKRCRSDAGPLSVMRSALHPNVEAAPPPTAQAALGSSDHPMTSNMECNSGGGSYGMIPELGMCLQGSSMLCAWKGDEDSEEDASLSLLPQLLQDLEADGEEEVAMLARAVVQNDSVQNCLSGNGNIGGAYAAAHGHKKALSGSILGPQLLDPQNTRTSQAAAPLHKLEGAATWPMPAASTHSSAAADWPAHNLSDPLAFLLSDTHGMQFDTVLDQPHQPQSHSTLEQEESTSGPTATGDRAGEEGGGANCSQEKLASVACVGEGYSVDITAAASVHVIKDDGSACPAAGVTVTAQPQAQQSVHLKDVSRHQQCMNGSGLKGASTVCTARDGTAQQDGRQYGGRFCPEGALTANAVAEDDDVVFDGKIGCCKVLVTTRQLPAVEELLQGALWTEHEQHPDLEFSAYQPVTCVLGSCGPIRVCLPGLATCLMKQHQDRVHKQADQQNDQQLNVSSSYYGLHPRMEAQLHVPDQHSHIPKSESAPAILLQPGSARSSPASQCSGGWLQSLSSPPGVPSTIDANTHQQQGSQVPDWSPAKSSSVRSKPHHALAGASHTQPAASSTCATAMVNYQPQQQKQRPMPSHDALIEMFGSTGGLCVVCETAYWGYAWQPKTKQAATLAQAHIPTHSSHASKNSTCSPKEQAVECAGAHTASKGAGTGVKGANLGFRAHKADHGRDATDAAPKAKPTAAKEGQAALPDCRGLWGMVIAVRLGAEIRTNEHSVLLGIVADDEDVGANVAKICAQELGPLFC